MAIRLTKLIRAKIPGSEKVEPGYGRQRARDLSFWKDQELDPCG